MRQEHRFEEAIDELRGALALAPKDLELPLELGDLLLRRKRPDEAAEVLTKALALSPADPEKLLSRRAEAYWALGKLKEAFADLKRCADASPTAPQLSLRAARAALACGETAYVDALLSRWDQDAPANAALLRGLRALSRREYDDAARSFEKGGPALPGEVAASTYAALAKGLGYLSRSLS